MSPSLETSLLICIENQFTAFSIMEALALCVNIEFRILDKKYETVT